EDHADTRGNCEKQTIYVRFERRQARTEKWDGDQSDPAAARTVPLQRLQPNLPCAAHPALRRETRHPFPLQAARPPSGRFFSARCLNATSWRTRGVGQPPLSLSLSGELRQEVPLFALSWPTPNIYSFDRNSELYFSRCAQYSDRMRENRHETFVDHDACGVGFVAHLGSTGSRDVVDRALTALKRLSHRGGVDADGASGDGAGLLTAIPQEFIRHQAREERIELPETYGLGMVFLPREQLAQACAAIEAAADKTKLRFLGWRSVPTDPSILGPRASATLPTIRQCFVVAKDPRSNLEPLLFRCRKRAEREAPSGTYICSLSSRTLVYKGLLAPRQLPAFYRDLASPSFATPFAIFHQRYSTNTRPTWHLAQPFRFVAHNGEINTLSAN